MATYNFTFGGKPATLEIPDDMGNEPIIYKTDRILYMKYIQHLINHIDQLDKVLCKHFRNLPNGMPTDIINLRLSRQIEKEMFLALND